MLLVLFGGGAFVATLLLGPAAQSLELDQRLERFPSGSIRQILDRLQPPAPKPGLRIRDRILEAPRVTNLPPGKPGKSGKIGAPVTGKDAAYSKPIERSGPAITHGELKFKGTLSRELIAQVIQSHRAQIRYCYERELTRTPRLTGKLQVHFVINGRGQIDLAEGIASPDLAATDLQRCILDRVRAWRFPIPTGGGEVDVIYPFLFDPLGK